MTYEDDLLQSWNKKYGYPVNVTFDGYTNYMNKDYDGVCYYPSCLYDHSRIQLRPFFKGKRFAVKCALWHEFCHHASYCEFDYKGHGLPWLRCYLRKPLLVVGMFIVAIYVKF